MSGLEKYVEGEQEARKRPAFKAEISPLCLVIWENAGPVGTFYSVKIERNYLDSKGAGFKKAVSFRPCDISKLHRLLYRAEEWLAEHIEQPLGQAKTEVKQKQ